MSGDVMHGTWLPAAQQLFVWGETGTAARRKGRQPKVPAHPFQSSPDTLATWLAQHGLSTGHVWHKLTLWLPATSTAPLPSPELVATGVAQPDGPSELAAYQVHGVLLPIQQAMDLLLALPITSAPSTTIGADLQAWRLADLMALQLIATQQVLPVLSREGHRLRAGWQPLPDPAALQRITQLAQSLPPVCRAAVDNPAGAPASRFLIDSFLSAAVDRLVRDSAVPPRAPAATPGSRWLQGLLDDDPGVHLTGPAAESLFTDWQTWAKQTEVAGNDVVRVTFRLDEPDHEDKPWTLDYLLQATDDPSLIVPATLVWREQNDVFSYLDRRFDQPQERLLRALGYAARVFAPIKKSLRAAAPEHAQLTAPEAFTFLKEAAPLLEQSGFGILVPAWATGKGDRFQVRARATATPTTSNAKSVLTLDSLISFNWQLTLAGEPLDQAEFERLVALKSPLVQVRGQWVVLDLDQMQRALTYFEQRIDTLGLPGALRLALGGDQEAAQRGIVVEQIDAENGLRQLLDGLANSDQLDILDPPAGLHGQLRPYQQRGYSWLTFLGQYGLGACLADDMGLGKTIQTITLLLHARERLDVTMPTLLVCPTSVVGNWVRELHKFAPSLRIMVHRGADRARGEDLKALAQQHDVVLTSYALLTRDRDVLTSISWSSVVLDEAQNIKNPAAKTSQAARALNATTRVALTGTPVENRLSDLWSIMAFLNPGYLGSHTSFQRELAKPIERTGDPQAREKLKRLTAPFVLRRLKTDQAIIADLPAKLEMNVYCPLTPEQATLYQAVVDEAVEQIEQADDAEGAMARRGQVLSMLTRLKQVCNHPALFLKDGSTLDQRSGKLVRLHEMLEEVYAEDDRALIFTQFAEMGHLLQEYLGQTFYDDVLFLHGGVSPKKRDTLIQRFQATSGPRVFILSLKAGGTGLNLTSANHVFHFDRWWNPAVENQATDRAFRIGQTRNVQVHRFMCGGTLEERIDDLISSKRALAESVFDTSEAWLTELSTDQLHDLVALRRTDVAEDYTHATV